MQDGKNRRHVADHNIGMEWNRMGCWLRMDGGWKRERKSFSILHSYTYVHNFLFPYTDIALEIGFLSNCFSIPAKTEPCFAGFYDKGKARQEERKP